jgi:hypothetical protein
MKYEIEMYEEWEQTHPSFPHIPEMIRVGDPSQLYYLTTVVFGKIDPNKPLVSQIADAKLEYTIADMEEEE